MQSKRLWCLVGSIVLLSATASVRADVDPDLYDYDALIDSDGNTTTGCSVALHDANFNGSVSGVEYIVTARVERLPMSAKVDSVTIRQCISGWTFTMPSDFDGNWAVGLQTGVAVPSPYDFADVVEFYVPLASLGDPNVVRLYFHATQAATGANDVLLTTTGGHDAASPILFSLSNRTAPALSHLALACCALLLSVIAGWGLRQRGRLVTTIVAVGFLSSLAMTVWAATIMLDGNVTDWVGVPRAGTDALDDSSIGDPAEDIAAAFVTADAQNLYFRMDQVNLAPVVCGDGIIQSGEYCESDADCHAVCDVVGGAVCGSSVAGAASLPPPVPCTCSNCMCVGDCDTW
jgi:hypothetical protein